MADSASADAGAAAAKVVARGLDDSILERMTDAFLALDREWRVVYMNSAAMGLNARPRPDVIGRSHWEVWPHTLGSQVERQYRRAMETQRPVHFEHHYRLPGYDFWHSIHAYPDENGLSVFYRDITEQKRGDELARLLATVGSRLAGSRDAREVLRIVAEAALPLLGQWSAAYLVTDEWRVTDVEVSATDAQHLSVLRRVVAALPVSATDDRLPFNRALHSGEPVLLSPVDASFYAALGDQTLEDFVRALAPKSLLSVALVARGRTIGGITYGSTADARPHDEQDITAAREFAVPAALALDSARLFDAESRARREAEAARLRAEEANRSKVDFLRAMSHELRTPLNAIGGYAQLLLLGVRGQLNATQRADVERIERNQLHVSRLISDVVNFTRIETGRIEYHIDRVEVQRILSALDAIAAVPAEGGRVRVIACEPDIAVWADEAKATQVVLNLVTNAIKHTPEDAAITVFCEAPAGGNDVRISVKDSGPGIAKDDQERVFEPFVQLGRQLSRPVEGLGLGLAIARDLARGMSGDLTLAGDIGRGTTFTLVLPRAPAPDSPR